MLILLDLLFSKRQYFLVLFELIFYWCFLGLHLFDFLFEYLIECDDFFNFWRVNIKRLHSHGPWWLFEMWWQFQDRVERLCFFDWADSSLVLKLFDSFSNFSFDLQFYSLDFLLNIKNVLIKFLIFQFHLTYQRIFLI